MSHALGLVDSGSDWDWDDLSLSDTDVLELRPACRLAGGTGVQPKSGEKEPGTEQIVSRPGDTEHRNDDQDGKRLLGPGSLMIYESWLDRLFHRHTDESLKLRAAQARIDLGDDEDITDRTHERLKKSHISLGFTLDRVIKDLHKHGLR